MGVIEFMAAGNSIPDMPLTMGSGPVLLGLMLAVLGVSVFGMVRAIPRRSPVPALRPVHAEGR